MAEASGKVALFLPALCDGGAERVFLNLAAGIARLGHPVDLVLSHAEGVYLDQVPRSVRLIELNGRALCALRTTASLPAFMRYLQRERPEAVLAGLNANFVGVFAKRLTGVPRRLVISEHNTFSVINGQRPSWCRMLATELVRRSYVWADGIVAVSEGVAADLARTSGIDPHHIQVIYNPVVTAELLQKKEASLDDPWFRPGEPPVILGVGRLTAQKNFALLIEAVAVVRKSRAVRLLILGEGEDRRELESMVNRLSLNQEVRLPGFVPNPYPYMVGASLFVLSSSWEGLPTVLIEALFCGARVIATDCPSGPREILHEGRYGSLVPVGDVAALSRAIDRSLSQDAIHPPRESWLPFTLESTVDKYLNILFAT